MFTFPKSRDVLAGIFVIAVGIAFLIGGLQMPIGSAERMGPGHFPLMLSLLTILLGGCLALRGWFATPEPPRPIPERKIALVLAAVVVFALVLRPAGFLPAAFLATGMSALASKFVPPRKAAAIAACVALGCYLIFVVALGVPVPAFGPLLGA